MYFNRDKASLRLNVLLEARGLVGAAMKKALDRALIGSKIRSKNLLRSEWPLLFAMRRRLRAKLPKNGCVKE